MTCKYVALRSVGWAWLSGPGHAQLSGCAHTSLENTLQVRKGTIPGEQPLWRYMQSALGGAHVQTGMTQ